MLGAGFCGSRPYIEISVVRRLCSIAVIAVLGGLLGHSAGGAAANPESAAEWTAQGQEQADAGRFEEAIASYQQALALDPNFADAHLKLAGGYLLRQDYAQAIEHYQRVIGLDPANGRAFIGLGIAYLHQGRYGPAEEALREAAGLRPDKRQEIEALLAAIESRREQGASPAHPVMPPSHAEPAP
jgi:tetratricopeptide (TPR) repeat protein